MEIETLGCKLSTNKVYFDRLNNVKCVIVGPVYIDGAACIVEEYDGDLTDKYHLTEWTALEETGMIWSD